MNLNKKFNVITQTRLRFRKNLCELSHKCVECSKRMSAGTVQGAVATWRPWDVHPTRRQVATAPCTVPALQLDSVIFAVLTMALSFANACAEAPGKSADVYMGSRPATLAAGEPEPPRVY